MMTKKTMTILSVFMIVALTAVGFAAWLIVGTIEAETTGSFVSNELEDKYFKVEVEFDAELDDTDETKGNITFGRPSGTYTGNNAWLSYSNNDAKEKLSVTATVKFIPDAGFSKKDGEVRDMNYFLKQVTENSDGSVLKTEYRTIRVVIDIPQALGLGTEKSDNYKWFDMAVELGYIQYPTAYVVAKDGNGNIVAGQTFKDAAKKLQWVTKDSVKEEKALVPLAGNDYSKFENGCLAIDLKAEDFFVNYGSGETSKEATAEIQIDFAWGEALKLVVGAGEEQRDVFENPYVFFGAKKPNEIVKVDKYFDDTTEALVNTNENDNPDTADIIENLENKDAKTIRYKDLAQRMLDYIYNRLNYTAPVYNTDKTAVTEAQKGVQFSLTLLEGKAIS